MVGSQILMDASSSVSYRPAPHGLRIAAWIIDFFIVALLVIFLPQPIPPILPILIFIAYHAVLIWLVDQTVGKALMGLKVKRIRKDTGLLWSLGRASIGYFIVDVLGLGMLATFVNWQHRCLHDYAFGSVVVYTEAPSKISLMKLSERLEIYVQRHKSALKKKKKRPPLLVLAIWAFLEKLSGLIQSVINILTGSPDPKPCVAKVLSMKAVLMMSVVTTTISTALIASVPGVQAAVAWLFTPNTLLSPPQTNTPTSTLTATLTITPLSTHTTAPFSTISPPTTIFPSASATSTRTVTHTPTFTSTFVFTPTPTPSVTPTITPTSTSITRFITPPIEAPIEEAPEEVPEEPPPEPTPERCGALCEDGTTSTSTGSGACSYHGGVKEWLYPPDCPE